MRTGKKQDAADPGTQANLTGGTDSHRAAARSHFPGRSGFLESNLKYYYLMLSLPIIYFLIFRYIPLFGNILAFRRYIPGGSIFGTQWVGLKYFRMFMSDSLFWRAFFNTLILSFFNILFTFPVVIIFVLLVNEVHNRTVRKLYQTISFLPYFLSLVVIVGMLKEILSPSTGLVNQIITNLGGEPIFFVNEPAWFRPIFVTSGIWQFLGFNAIIYLAALSNIDERLYESAMIDGCGRWKQTLHITLPGLAPMIIITLILRVGTILIVGFEKALLLYTPNNSTTSDLISLLVYRQGILNSDFSYATAVDLFNAFIGIILIGASNYLARKNSETSLF
jgi:putative aldouronate transport system permease protein